MKTFELSNKKTKTGRRKFKQILYEIYPDDCLVNNTGTKYNQNGCTFIRKYCEKSLNSVKDMSLTVEFVDDSETEIIGHGCTGLIDGLPIFEDATVVGHFTNGYISDIEIDGETHTVCIGEGLIDEMRYPHFVKMLEDKINNGEFPKGSIEIYKTPENDSIVYLDGWKEKGRVPVEFIHSGFTLLGIEPACSIASILEMNNKKEEKVMDEKVMSNITETIRTVITETVVTKENYEHQITELNSVIAEKDNEISELNARIEALTSEKNDAIVAKETAESATEQLTTELNEVKCEKAVGELNEKLSVFSKEQIAYANSEIEAFKQNPLVSEVNSVVSKIYEGIGKAKVESEKMSNELNSDNSFDIFSPMLTEDLKVDSYTDLF